MKAAHSPAELAKGAMAFAAIIGFFVIVIHQLTRMLG
jgi:hypothetical protein